MKLHKKNILNISVAILSVGILASCGDETGADVRPYVRDDTAWFSESELSSVGLKGLTAPSLSTTESMQTSATGVIWILTYKQKASEAEFNAYAEVVFSYLGKNYDTNYYGAESLYASGENDVYYKIETPESVSGCYTTNPNPRYEFYYATTKDIVGEGTTAHFAADKVFKLTVDYSQETYLQLFVEYATDESSSFVAYYKNA